MPDILGTGSRSYFLVPGTRVPAARHPPISFLFFSRVVYPFDELGGVADLALAPEKKSDSIIIFGFPPANANRPPTPRGASLPHDHPLAYAYEGTLLLPGPPTRTRRAIVGKICVPVHDHPARQQAERPVRAHHPGRRDALPAVRARHLRGFSLARAVFHERRHARAAEIQTVLVCFTYTET